MFFDLIEKRRSIRKFKPDTIEKKKVDRLIESALRSPSSRSLNPWRFVVIDNRELLEELSRSKPHGASFLRNAPLGIVVCADGETSDVWIEDTSIASTFIQLAAEELNLGSCWIQIRKREHSSGVTAEEQVRKLLGIPETINVESIIAIGYPDEEKPPHTRESLESEKIFFNRFGQ
ncbi:MAG: nitroreductase family protein [Desulfobacteraceae bacterium]